MNAQEIENLKAGDLIRNVSEANHRCFPLGAVVAVSIDEDGAPWVPCRHGEYYLPIDQEGDDSLELVAPGPGTATPTLSSEERITTLIIGALCASAILFGLLREIIR